MIPEIEAEHQNGYLGEIMVYKPTNEVGVVEGAVESKTGWTVKVLLKLKDGTVKEGPPSDFVDAIGAQRSDFLYCH